MSRYTYAGPFRNPTDGWVIRPTGEEDADGLEIVGVYSKSERNADGSCTADTLIKTFAGDDAGDDASEYVEGRREFYEEDHSDYLEENRFEINRMERYESWRNER